MDPGVDDIGPGGRQPCADPVEQGLTVGSKHAHSRRSGLRIIFDNHIGFRLADMRLGRRDLPCVGELPRGRLGEPVTVGQPPCVRPGGARLPAKPRGQDFLAILDDRRAAMLFVPKPEPFLCRLEQGSEQRPLPLVPDARADCTDVDDGEDQEQPQALRTLHLVNKILDRLGLCEIAFECG
jgi:hypothetical protein